MRKRGIRAGADERSPGKLGDRLTRLGLGNATYSATDCAASTSFVVLVGNPEYRVECGPMEPGRCTEVAEAAARDALRRDPAKHIGSITLSANGSFVLVFDDGSRMSRIVD